MLKKLFAFLAIISLTLAPISQVNAAVKAGSACPKVGNTAIASGKTYTCIKSGKKLVWDKGKINDKPGGNDQLTISQVPESQLVLQSMQKLSDQFKLIESSGNSKFEIIIENSKDQQLVNLISLYLNKSYFSMLSWTENINFDKIIVLNYRTQNWLEANSKKYCLENWGFTTFSNANIGVCTNKPRVNMIIISPAAIAQDNYDFQSDNVQVEFDQLSVDRKSRLMNLGPHEFFHTWQYSLFGKNWPLLPSWFVEGFAEVFANLIRASMRNDGSYSAAFSDWRTKNDVDWSKNACKDSISKITYDMKTQCQYSQGMVVAEYYLYKFDGFKSLNNLGLSLQSKSFSESFKDVTKMPLDDFYNLADQYLISQGWIAGK